ncbi:MAG TPA: hypothetical protein VGU20_10490 [Stellaceae bacterium]|nr:hypothetical protein [Stellaceae bacterium]
MWLFDSIISQLVGGLAGMFAWLSVQPSQPLGWLSAIAAGAMFSAIIWKVSLNREKRTA